LIEKLEKRDRQKSEVLPLEDREVQDAHQGKYVTKNRKNVYPVATKDRCAIRRVIVLKKE
jgi:hypothetical protein